MTGLREIVEWLVESPLIYGASQWISDPNRLAPLRRALVQVPHDSLLDLGCGIGDLCGITGARYTGVDMAPARIAYARRHYAAPGRRFEVGDAMALDPALGHHDVVAIISVLHHCSDAEVLRCLAALSAVSPRRLFLVDVALERAGVLCRRVFVPLDPGRFYRTTAAWRALVESAGWRIDREDRCAAPLGIFPYMVLIATPPAA